MIAPMTMRNLFALLAAVLLFRVPAPAQWNWQSPVPQGNTLLSVEFIDNAQGWATGEDGTIIHTSTGGTSWDEQEYGLTDNVLALAMASDTEGWAAGDNGLILHTSDGGGDWLEQASGVSAGLNA